MDVGAWLRNIGLPRYEQAFRDNDIDVHVLRRLTADDLRELGVDSIGHRRRLLYAIAALGETEAAEPRAKLADETVSTEAERRQLTVMFCDLVGSTALAASLDPEDLREVLGAYHRAVYEIVTAAEGYVAKYMGDGILAYFGYPHAHEHDAEQAVQSALALIERVGQLQSGASALAARVGIATGLVVVGDLIGTGDAQERGVVGETPNLAARLQELAPTKAVLISETTRRLVGNLFDYRDLGVVQVKGLAAPVPAWQVLRESTVHNRFAALRPASLSPLIGREAEIELLVRRWARAKDGEGQIVLICGEAGIGKSRIAAELQERLESERSIRLRYFCSPRRRDSAFHPFIARLERAAEFHREDTATAKLDKLTALLSRSGDNTPETVAVFADLLALPTEGRYPPPPTDPRLRRELTLSALVGQLERLAQHRPVLFVFEDTHWIDSTSLELLERVAERVRQLPVLMIVTHRPEFEPPWTGESQVTSLTLSRLGRRESIALIEGVAGGKALPAEILDRVAERTDGIPLFVEELTKTLLEAGLLKEEDGRYVLAAPLLQLAIPSSLQDSLMARLDRLAPVKEVAQIGAAIGREFPTLCWRPPPVVHRTSCVMRSTSSFVPAWYSDAARRPKRPSSSNMLSSRTQPTARYYALAEKSCTPPSPRLLNSKSRRPQEETRSPESMRRCWLITGLGPRTGSAPSHIASKPPNAREPFTPGPRRSVITGKLWIYSSGYLVTSSGIASMRTLS
jgi:class 3 adenylate cyclase